MATESAYKIQEFVAHSTEVTCLAFGGKSQVFATGGQDCKVNIWSIGNTTSIWSLGSNKSPIQSLCFDTDEQYVVSGTQNGSIKVFDLNEGRLARHLAGHQVNVSCLQYHAFGEFIVSGSSDCTMKVWDVRSKNCLQTYTGHEKEITCVRFSPDGRWVASSSKDGQLHIWDIVAGKNLQTFKSGPSTHVTSFEFNPLELILATVTSSRTVRLWDLETMQPISSTPPDSSHVKAICYTNDDKSFCSATKDSLKLWNWDPSIKLMGSAEVPWDRVVELKSTSDNTIIGGAFMSNFVSIWSVGLDNLPTPSSKSTAAIPINPSSSDAKQSNRSSTRIDQKYSLNHPPPTSHHPQQLASSPGERSPVRQQWGNSPTIASNMPPSPSRISNSSPISKKSQDLFAKALSQGKSPDKPVLSQPADAYPPSLHLPSSSSSSTTSSQSNSNPSGNMKSDSNRVDDSADMKYDNMVMDDFKSDLILDIPSSDHKSSMFSNARPDLRPRCLDVIEGLDDLDIASMDDIGPPSSSPPQVKWESEHAAIDMASSLGESFWRRFQESRAAANANANASSASSSLQGNNIKSAAAVAKDTNVDNPGIAFQRGNGSKAETDNISTSSSNSAAMSSDDMLRNLLPPSRYKSNTIEDSIPDISSTAIRASPSTSSDSKSPTAAYLAVRQQVDALLLSSTVFTTSLSQRLTSLRVLRRSWEKGDIDSVIDHLASLLETVDDFTANTTISPTAVNAAANAATSPIIQQLLEFFENIDFHRGSYASSGQKMTNLTFDHAIAFMRILNATLRIRSPGDVSRVSKLVISYQMEVVLVKVIQLYELFGDIIRQTKAIAAGIGGAGVDLIREERIRKYKQIDNNLNKIKAKVEMFSTALSGGSSSTNIPGISSKVNDVLARFHTLIR